MIVKRWPKWYKDTLHDCMEYLSEEDRLTARKVISLLDEAVTNGVLKDKHTFHGTPLPDGYVYKFDDLLNEAHDLFCTINIKFI